MLKYTTFFFCFIMINIAIAQEKIELYPDGLINKMDNAELADNTPEFYMYRPAQVKSPIAFLVIPGGGYARVAIQHEGHDVAQKLQDLGYVAFVLRYRLPNATQQKDKRIAPIQDAQTALSYIRDHADLDKIKHIGVIGFSAGGHLAATLSTHFETDYRTGQKANAALRPDFSVLAYPVISMEDGITHKGSKNNLIGPELLAADVKRFSNEGNIGKNTPPAFLMHAADDKAVPIANSERYLHALEENGIPTTLFRYETGGHGFGLNNKTDDRSWFDAMLEWTNRLFD